MEIEEDTITDYRCSIDLDKLKYDPRIMSKHGYTATGVYESPD
jgi:hypothetical protein